MKTIFLLVLASTVLLPQQLRADCKDSPLSNKNVCEATVAGFKNQSCDSYSKHFLEKDICNSLQSASLNTCDGISNYGFCESYLFYKNSSCKDSKMSEHQKILCLTFKVAVAGGDCTQLTIHTTQYTNIKQREIIGVCQGAQLSLERKEDKTVADTTSTELEMISGDLSDYYKKKKNETHSLKEKYEKLRANIHTGNIAAVRHLLAGDITTVRELLDFEADVDDSYSRNSKRKTLLFLAISSGSHEMTELLLNKGANPNQADKYGRTPLSEAINKGHQEIVRLLLEHKADPNRIDRQELRSPLTLAILGQQKGIIQLLLDKYTTTPEQLAPLNAAAYVGDLQTAEFLLKKKGVNPNTTDPVGFTPLFDALKYGHLELAKVLIAHGADIHHQDEYGDSPIIVAARAGNTELVQLMIDKGVDINAFNKVRRTPLLESIKDNQFNMVKFLIEKGANLNSNDNTGPSPLEEAIKLGHADIARLLIEKGAKIDIQDTDGATPLIWAAKNKLNEIAKLLLEKNANPNLKNLKGDSALSFALSTNNKEIVDLLLHHGAVVDDDLRLQYPHLLPAHEKKYVPTAEAKTFAHLYILNKENREAQIQYNQGVQSKLPAQQIKHLKQIWDMKSNALISATDKLGVPFQSPDHQIIREIRVINGVETPCYYRNPKFYKGKSRPILMYTHGDGARNKMTLDRFDPLLDYYISKGFVVVAPNFREGREVEDVYQVGQGIRKIKDLFINPDQIFLTGISAGSHLNFRMLEKIEKEKLQNPFAAAQFFSTVADETFKNRVHSLPKNMPYLIVHGEKDDVAPAHYMKEVYQEMVQEGFNVTGYFSPSGNHHLVDAEKKIDHTTRESDPIYLDLVKWPEHFIPFFSKAQKAQSFYDRT